MADVPGAEGGKRGKGPTPVMQQYFRAKEQVPDALLFFRLGDFYEMFYDDARKASAVLGLTLTRRGLDDVGEPIPMAGVPHHAATEYLAKLLEAGLKVAFCEQMADPSTVRGIVPREVTRVVSPGLSLDEATLDARRDNTIAAVTARSGGYVVCAYDVTAGRAKVESADDVSAVLAALVRAEPREVLLAHGVEGGFVGLDTLLARALVRPLPSVESPLAASLAADHAGVLAGISGDERDALLALLGEAQRGQPRARIVLDVVDRGATTSELGMDETVVRSLELVQTTRGERRGSLLEHLDETRTSMGARLLRRRLLAPVSDLPTIRRRHDAVEQLVSDPRLAERLGQALGAVLDLERLATRASLGVSTPKDLGALRASLAASDEVARVLGERVALPHGDALAAFDVVDRLPGLHARLARDLADEPAAELGKGGVIRAGADPTLDAHRHVVDHARDLVLALEQRERTRTGIGSLKIKYNRVFGYAIEVTRSNLGSVPPEYVRKQTIANGERYVTEELADLEARILSAESDALAREAALFEGLVAEVAAHGEPLRSLGRALAALDVSRALAHVAARDGWVRPVVDESRSLELRDARHPVVEAMLPTGRFVPNDVVLDADGVRLAVITGPNMAGKSTVMRQAALAVVLAQMGAFVPCTSARIGRVDRLFSRVGASDDVTRGQSTFMVEMTETAAILAGATSRSLVVVDEIGRGTSTYDGLAIAWAVAEHLLETVRCRTLFATHYHELCALPERHAGAVNWNVLAREQGGEVTFLHRLAPGAANRSYGVSVARLAGLPELVLARARAILADLEAGKGPVRAGGAAQLTLFAPPEAPAWEKTLRGLDVERLTPLDALVALARLRAMLPPEDPR